MFTSQCLLLLAIVAIGRNEPSQEIWTIVVLASVVAIWSATQDIVIDAYRREILDDIELGLGNSIHVNAYRVAGLIPGSLSLILADHLAWSSVFTITALFMLPGIALSLVAEEPGVLIKPKTLTEAVVEPFHEFIKRKGVGSAFVS